MSWVMRSFLILSSCTLLFACGDNVGVQQISGRLDQSTFVRPMDSVVLIGSRGVISETPIGAGGDFFVQAPAGGRYRIVFGASGASRSKLVFPRAGGIVDKTFRVHRSMGSIDLGAVRYVGDPTLKPFVFTCTGETDPNGMCVDDDGAGQGGATDAEGDNQQCGDHQDGQDGENTDGENTDGENTNDGETADDMENDDAGLDNEASVGQTNIESDVGCHDDGGGDNGDNGGNDGGSDLRTLPTFVTASSSQRR